MMKIKTITRSSSKNALTRSAILACLILVLQCPCSMQSFPLLPVVPIPSSKNTNRIPTFARQSFNDNTEDLDNDDRASPSSASTRKPEQEGQDLTEQFYQFIQNSNPNTPLGDDSYSSPPGRSNLFTKNDPPSPAPQRRKFTGVPSNSFLFDDDDENNFNSPVVSSSTGNNNGNKESNLQSEYRREFELVGRFERTLQYQALAVLAALVVVLSVGFTGGITDGSDRYFDDDVFADDSIESYYPNNNNNAQLQQSWEDYLQDPTRRSGSSSVFL